MEFWRGGFNIGLARCLGDSLMEFSCEVRKVLLDGEPSVSGLCSVDGMWNGLLAAVVGET